MGSPRQAAVLLAAISGSIFSQVPGGVREFRLLQPDRGWFLKDSRLFASDLWGQERSDITPLLSTGQEIAAVFFLDPLHGWAVLNKTSDNSWAEISVSRTTDGGQNWTDSPLKLTTALLENYGGNARIVFVDESHGWMALQYISSSAMSSDAGKTWTQLPDPPVFGEIGFWNTMSGWVIGGPLGDQFHITRDGGKHWRRESIPRPTAVQDATGVVCGNPRFTPEGTAIFPVTYTLRDQTAVLVTYANAGQGANWNVVHVEPNMPGWTATNIVEAHLIRSVKRPHGIETANGNAHVIAVLPEGIPDEGVVMAISFPDESHGWLLYDGTQCAPIFRDCVNVVALLATENGGAALTAIDIARSRPYTPRAGRAPR